MVADWGFGALDVRGRSEREGEWLGRMGDGAMIWRCKKMEGGDERVEKKVCWFAPSITRSVYKKNGLVI
jgi:hypothetical protein